MILAIANSKGGVGKTTVSTHLCDWLKLHDYSVVLVDCDSQRLSSKWMQMAAPEIEVVVIKEDSDVGNILLELDESNDAVIVDAPGQLEGVTVEILQVADYAIIPSSGSQLDVSGLAWTITTIRSIQEKRPDNKPVTAVLPVKADARLKTTRNLISKAKRIGFGVTKTTLAAREIYSQVSGLENHTFDGWEIPPSLLWNLGRSKTVRTAALEMDAAFREMFPEVCEDDPNVIRNMVTPKKPRNNNKGMKHGS